MKPLHLAFAILALALAAIGPARAADLRGASAFLEQLYSHYPERPSDRFDPVGANAGQVFDPSMIALFAENDRVTPKGDVGAIDGDPICDCQDSGDMRSRIVWVRLITPGEATAEVELTFPGDAPRDVRKLRLTLIAVHGAWRVYDVHSKDTPSLRAYLIQSNRQAAPGH